MCRVREGGRRGTEECEEACRALSAFSPLPEIDEVTPQSPPPLIDDPMHVGVDPPDKPPPPPPAPTPSNQHASQENMHKRSPGYEITFSGGIVGPSELSTPVCVCKTNQCMHVCGRACTAVDRLGR